MRVAIAALVLAVPLAASGQAWSASFPPATAAGWLSAPGGGVIVVGAGARSSELSAASTALASALRASGKASQVQDDAHLGDLSELDDRGLVRRCRDLPVDEVMVVRVFEASV